MKAAKVHISKVQCLLVTAIMSLFPVMLRAQRATQVVRYSVTGVSEGRISGTPRVLPAAVVGTGGFGSAAAAAPGSAEAAPIVPVRRRVLSRQASGETPTTTATVWQASYQISNNEENKKLSISIDTPMPGGMALTADIAAPRGADASGPVDLETSAQDVVTAIGTGSTGEIPIEFLVTTPQGSTDNAGSRKVTFTFITGS